MKAIILAMALEWGAMASTITLTMDEVSSRPINGLTVARGGESFTFSNPSQTLFYNSFGPGHVTFVQDPSIQGSTSPFGIAFSVPVDSIRFGLAELSATPQMPLAQVSLFFNSNAPFATISFNSSLTDPFAEGQFNFAGRPVTNILITPNAGPPALAFDNLSVDAIPEPSTFFMLVGAATVAGLGLFRRRRARRDLWC